METIDDALFLPHSQLQSFIDLLWRKSYEVIGPHVSQNTIEYLPLHQVDELPFAYRDKQEPGRYHLVKTSHERYFAWANGAQALKPMTFKASQTLWQAHKNANQELEFSTPSSPLLNTAVIGVRACDLAALAIQDQHFLQGDYVDPFYQSQRQHLFLVAVNCSHPASTCFCASTGDGPHVEKNADIVLTELDDGFVVEITSQTAKDIMSELLHEPAQAQHWQQKSQQLQQACQAQTRSISKKAHVQISNKNKSQVWETLGRQCLACGNCTAVCPTCFCHQQQTEADLSNTLISQLRLWDSCFNADHSYFHGTVVRAETKFRYRQWLTHKFSTWVEQFARSGCVGCGRCISWCPVGIDVTAVIADLIKEACDESL